MKSRRRGSDGELLHPMVGADERLIQLLELAPTPVFVADACGEVVWFNAGGCGRT